MNSKTNEGACAGMLPLILAEVDGLLDETERGSLAAHLAGCRACAAERAALKRSLALLARREAEAPPSAYDELRRKVRHGLDTGRGSRSAPGWAWVPAALLLLVMALWGIDSGGRPRGGAPFLAQVEQEGRLELERLGSEPGAWREAAPAFADDLPPEALIELLSESELEALSERLTKVMG